MDELGIYSHAYFHNNRSLKSVLFLELVKSGTHVNSLSNS